MSIVVFKYSEIRSNCIRKVFLGSLLIAVLGVRIVQLWNFESQ